MTRSRLLSGLAVAAGIAVLVLASRREERFREVSDGAVLEIATSEALRGHQLVGPYSRFGWNHPGALYFYFEAPWYVASGRHTSGMEAGALVLNLIAIAIIGGLCLRWLGPIPASFVAAALTAYLVRAPDLIVSVWNPHVIVLPMAAVVLLLAAFADTGRPLLLFAAIVGGSFIVQTHIAMAPLVAAVGLAAAAMQPRAVRSCAWQAVALSVALWTGPLIDEFAGTGNLTKLVRFFTGPATIPAGQSMATAAGAWTTELTRIVGPRMPLALGSDLHPVLSVWLTACVVVEVLLLAILAVQAWRTLRRSSACLLGSLFVASAVALLSVSRISGQLVDHEVFWISAIGALNIGAIGGAIGDAAGGAALGRPSGVARNVSKALVVGLVLVSVALGASGIRSVLNRTRTLDDHAVDAIVDDVRRQMTDRGAHRPLFRIEPGIAPAALGAFLQLYKEGVPFAVDRGWVHVLGESFRENGREDLVLTIGGSASAPRVTPLTGP